MVLGSEVNGIAEVEEVWTILNHQLKASFKKFWFYYFSDQSNCPNGSMGRHEGVRK